MNTKNLILTDTKKMTRAEWLEWRQPLNHVKKFILLYWGPLPLSGPNADMLKHCFNSPEWKAFKFPCVGGSEIGSLLGLSPYKSVIELFYEKVGLKEGFFEDNAATFWGKTLEDTVAEMWQYWEGSAESVIQNKNTGNLVRKCRRLNAYVQNKKFPWLYCSLDRVINKFAGKEEGVLECKTMNGYVAKVWESGLPPMYISQMQEQIAITELPFAEMAVLIDGRQYDVFVFNRHDGVIERIISESEKFHDMVKKGIECYLLYKATGEVSWLSELDKYSPEPDGSLSYESFLNQKWKEDGYEKAGGEVELHLARAYKYYSEAQKQLEDKQRECSNKLKAFLQDGAKIDLGANGNITWKANKNGSRAFRVNVKLEEGFVPNPEIIKTEPLLPVAEEVSRETLEGSTKPGKVVEFPVNRKTTENLPPGWED